MMAVNRYRLRHRAKQGARGAKLALALLAQTDTLLGVILLGNTLVAAAAATLTAVITKRLFGEGEAALALGTVAISFALMMVLLVVMRRTQLGRALRAIAESPKAAYLLGINVEGLFYLTSFAAAALGGAAGVLVGLSFNAILPFMGQPMLHKGIAVIILGGMGDIRGALIGGLFLGFAEVLTVAYVSSDFRDAVAFGLLFGSVAFRLLREALILKNI